MTGWVAFLAYALGLSGLIFRRLGSAEFGLWAVVLSTRALFGLVLRAREADHPEPTSAHNPSWPALSVAILIGVAVVILPALLLRLEGSHAVVARWVGVLILGDACFGFFKRRMITALKDNRRFSAVALVSVAQAVIGLSVAWSLTGPWGLIGVAIAMLASTLVAELLCAGFTWSSRPGSWLAHGEIIGLWRLTAADAGFDPLRGASRLAVAAGILIVASVYGAGAAGDYLIGAFIPATVAALVFAILNSASTRLADAQEAESTRLIRWMLVVGGAFAAIGFGAVTLNATLLLDAWVNATPTLAVRVLDVYALAGLVGLPGQVLVIAALAAGKTRILARVQGWGLATVFLSGLLAAGYSSIGPALATLVVTSVVSLVVLPLALRQSLGISLVNSAAQVLLGVGVGLVLTLMVSIGSTHLPGGPSGQVIGTVVGTFAVGFGFVSLGPRLGRWLLRWGTILEVGGGRVWIRQRDEVIHARRRLASERLHHPTVWSQSNPQLVSVRIATYNRGRLVAERAIASALNQTHKNIEVIVIGDHCDAETERAVRSVRDPRVRFENLARRGEYPAEPERRWMVAGTVPMNRALDLARGEWIAPLDDDDEFTPDHVEVLLDACRSRDLEFAYGAAEMEVQPDVWELIGWWPLAQGGIVHASVLHLARIAFLRHDLESWKLLEPGDWNLWKRMRAAGVRMGFVDRVVCRHYLGRPVTTALQ